MNDVPSMLPGTVFADRYQIVKQLGEGAFGAVFEARMQPMMRRVAVKVLHPEVVGHAQIAARFVREARILGELEHPHVVTVIDVGLANGVPFLVMELLDGETLGARVRRGAISMTEAMSLFLPVCAAVQAIHEKGIVHRDLKPDNIMLAQLATGFVSPKILDFGIAKSDARDGVGTRTNTVMGTPHYMSPEQAMDSKNIDARSDQWALAVILWEMLTGQKLFRGGHQVAILSAVIGANIPPIGQVLPGATPRLELAFAHALAREPSERFASVRDLAGMLLPLADLPTQTQWSRVFTATPLQELSAASSPRKPTDSKDFPRTVDAWPVPFPLESTQHMGGGTGTAFVPNPPLFPPGTFQPSVNPSQRTQATSSTGKIIAVVSAVALLALVGVGFAANGSRAAPDSVTSAASPQPVAVALQSAPTPTPAVVATVTPPRVVTPRPVALAPTPAPSSVPVPESATPMDQARACLRNNSIPAGNACVVQVLRGRASTEQELGLLAITYRSMGRTTDAVSSMRAYVSRFSTGPRVQSFQSFIDSNSN